MDYEKIALTIKIYMNWIKTAFGGRDMMGDSEKSACNDGQQLWSAVAGVERTEP